MNFLKLRMNSQIHANFRDENNILAIFKSKKLNPKVYKSSNLTLCIYLFRLKTLY